MLGKNIAEKDTLNPDHDYTRNASANESKGSAAITDDNGLYFINAKGRDPSLPTEYMVSGRNRIQQQVVPHCRQTQ